jgi:hypothetical protein
LKKAGNYAKQQDLVLDDTNPAATQKPEIQEKTAAGRRDDTDEKLARQKIPLSPNIPRAYKGLLLADVNPKNAYKDEVIADLGGLGLWVYEQMTWT